MPKLVNSPLISIIIPVFNRAATVATTITSMACDLDAWEMIVVDDGSSDDSANVARAAIAATGIADRARVEVQLNAGPGLARNRGAMLARGRYLAFLDSDDLWFPWTLATVLRVVAAADNPALIFLQNVDVMEPEEVLSEPQKDFATEQYERFLMAVMRTNTIRYASCNVLVRTDAFHALGGFTGAVRCSEDTDLFLRADQLGSCLLVRAPSMMAHVVGRGDSLSGDTARVIAGFRFMLKSEQEGRYPGGYGADAARTALLANSAVHSTRVAFAAGHSRTAYGLAFAHAGLIMRGGKSHWLPRLLLTPLLALLRPQSYPFRLRRG